MSELPADVVTASAALVLVVLVIWFGVSIRPALNQAVSHLHDIRNTLNALPVFGIHETVREIHADVSDHTEKEDDTDWAEKYQHLALAVANVIATDYKAPTTYNDGAALGYKDGVTAVIHDLHEALKPHGEA